MTHAFEALTPEVVLDALEAAGVRCDGRLMTLSSYENRVYLAHTEDGDAVVAKFYRPKRWSDAQILEEHAFAAELLAAEIPLAAPIAFSGKTLHQAHGFAYSISPRKGGRRPELESLDTLEWIGRFIARIHTVGATRPFKERPALNVQTFGTEPHDWLVAHAMVPPELQSAWQAAYLEAINLVATYVQWTPEGSTAQAAGPHFVDLDDARTGPAVQDLWMLLSGERAQRTQQLGALLDGYEQFRPFDRRELALIEPLRTLRMVHYSAWLARRWDDPAFPQAFPHFGTSAYWHEQVQLLHLQIEAMQEEPLYA
jgi:Ser/Thr protein kinase RdoA (MazF antagonist)